MFQSQPAYFLSYSWSFGNIMGKKVYKKRDNIKMPMNKSNGVWTTDAFSSMLFLVIVLVIVLELH